MPAVSTPAFHGLYGVKEAEICNKALWRIGAETIKNTDEDTKQARICKTVYGQTRDELLRMYPFTFSVRTILIPDDQEFVKPLDQYSHAFKNEDRLTVSGSTTASVATISSVTVPASHVIGDMVGRVISHANLSPGTRCISVTLNSIVLDQPALTTGTVANIVTYLPILKILEIGGNPENIFDVIGSSDGRRILTNTVTSTDGSTNYLEMKYIEQVIDPDSFDSMFNDALVLRIASKIAVTLSNSPQLGAAIQQEFAAIMQLAKNASAEERQIDAPDPWWTDRQDTDPRAFARR